MFVLGVLAGYPDYAIAGKAVVWLVVGAVLLFLVVSILKPEKPRQQAPRRVSARHGYFCKTFEEYHANELEIERVKKVAEEREKRLARRAAHQAHQQAEKDGRRPHPSGKVLKNGGKQP